MDNLIFQLTGILSKQFIEGGLFIGQLYNGYLNEIGKTIRVKADGKCIDITYRLNEKGLVICPTTIARG